LPNLLPSVPFQASEHEANVKDVEAALQRRFLQSQQLLKDELELGFVDLRFASCIINNHAEVAYF